MIKTADCRKEATLHNENDEIVENPKAKVTWHRREVAQP